MKRIFFSYSFVNKEEFRPFHELLVKYFSDRSIEVYAFVFDFKEKVDEKSTMDSAFREIDKCDLLLAELSHKSVGVGIEVGYAKAKGIKTGYLFRKDTEFQQTIAGSVDFVIKYETAADIIRWFEGSGLIQ